MARPIDIRKLFKNVQKRCYNTAELRLKEQLTGVMSALHDYVVQEQMDSNFGSMTGNWRNSFGVALYRDGRCVAVANMSSEENSPIRTTLINGDWFVEGSTRFDKSVQQYTFEVDGDFHKGSQDQVFYNQEVLSWLSGTRVRKKGFSYRIVSVTEYRRKEAKVALLRLSEELESKGGSVWQFHIG